MTASDQYRVVFAGTPDFAAAALQALIAMPEVTLAAVYTQPDRPAGRGRKPTASPVKELACAHDIAIQQPESLKDSAALKALQELAPALMIVAAYGLLLPSDILAVPRLGCINVHASLLPRWRGAAPIQRAILAGDAVTGITLMQMEVGLDTGPMLLRRECPIRSTDTAQTLHDRLALLGAQALSQALPALLTGTLEPELQDPRLATYAAKVTREEAQLDFAKPVMELDRAVRAYFPKPKATAIVEGQVMQILAGDPVVDARHGYSPGSVVPHEREFLIAADGGLLRVTRLQLPGKRPISGVDYRNVLRQQGR